MRRASLILTLTLALFRPDAKASEITTGDSAYQRRAYAAAAEAYHQAVTKDSANALSWYKLGNAHYRLRHSGEAAYAYAKALSLQPAFPEAADNLELIQQQVRPAGAKPVFFLRWWNALSRPANTNMWAVLALLCFSLPIILIAWGRYRKRGARFVPPQATGIGVSLGLVFAILAVSAAFAQKPRNKAVIMVQDAGARPTIGKADKVVLPEGLMLDVVRSGPAEISVRLPDGREALMQRSDIAVVE